MTYKVTRQNNTAIECEWISSTDFSRDFSSYMFGELFFMKHKIHRMLLHQSCKGCIGLNAYKLLMVLGGRTTFILNYVWIKFIDPYSRREPCTTTHPANLSTIKIVSPKKIHTKEVVFLKRQTSSIIFIRSAHYHESNPEFYTLYYFTIYGRSREVCFCPRQII